MPRCGPAPRSSPTSTAAPPRRPSTPGEPPKLVWRAVCRGALAAGVPAMSALSPFDVAAVQKRTVGVLVASQALGGLGTTVGIAVASVLAEEISGSASLAGLVQTMQVLGAAIAAYLLARLMGNRGRRVGLVTGYLIGGVGAAVCVRRRGHRVVPGADGRRGDARRQQRHQLPVPLRRGGPRRGRDPGAFAVDRDVGDDLRRRRRPQPGRPRRPAGRGRSACRR